MSNWKKFRQAFFNAALLLLEYTYYSEASDSTDKERGRQTKTAPLKLTFMLDAKSLF